MSEEPTPPVDALFSFGDLNGSTRFRTTQSESDGSADSRTDVATDGTARSHASGGAGPARDSDEDGSDHADRASEEDEGGIGRDDPSRAHTAEDARAGSRDAPQFQEWCADVGRALAGADSANVDVYVRSMLPSPGAKNAQMTVLDNISTLCEETAIADSTVHVWGERICLCDSCRESDTGALMIDTVRELENWGRRYDASTEPFFERTSQHSSVVGASYDGIVPPRVTAVLYVDNSLRGVFPSRFGDTPYSVSDFYRAVRSLSETGTTSDDRESAGRSDQAEPPH